MPVVLQQAHDEVARIGSLKVPELKEAASQLFGSAQSGTKAVVQAAALASGTAQAPWRGDNDGCNNIHDEATCKVENQLLTCGL